MAQILKLKLGASIMEYNQAKSNYEQAYQAADPDTKAWVDGFMESVARYQIKDPINDRSTRDHLTLAYQIGSEMIAQGREGYATPSASPRASTKNMFNGYSHEENVNNANEIARRYVKKNAPKQSTGTIGSTPASNVLHWTYNWNEGWDPGWALENESLTSKMNKFAAMLAGNLDSLIQHKNAGHILHGISPDKVNSYISVASDLNTFRQRLSSGAYNEDTQSGLMALADISSKVGVDPSAFKEYFGLNPKQEEPVLPSKIKEAYDELKSYGFTESSIDSLGLNPEFAQILKDKGAYVWIGPDNNSYIFDAWGKILPINYINTDPRLKGLEGSSYNFGMLTDESGKFWTGDVTKLASDSPYYNIFTQTRDKIINDNKKMYTLFPWYRNHNAFIDTEDPLLKAISNQYNFGDVTFADVSDLFEGPQRIVAVNPKGQDFSDEYGRFNPINTGVLDNDTQFFYIDNNGQLIKASAADLAPLYNPFGYNEGNKFDLPSYYRFAKSGALRTLQMPSDWKPENGSVTINGKKVSLQPNQKITENNETITAWATIMLNIFSKEHPDERDMKLLDHFVNEGATTDNILMVILEFIDEGKINFTPLCENLWKKALLKRQEEAAIVSKKKGGVLYAANGQVVDIYGNEMSISKPKRKSSITATKTIDEQLAEYRAQKNDPTYLATQQDEALKDKYGENEWSTADKVRLGSAIADLTSLVAAMFPGAGTVASAGLGVGSSLTNFGADIADDGFQLSDLGNLGKNLVFDLVGAVPGVGSAGKIGKVSKLLLNYGPKIFALYDGVQNGAKYAAAFKKFTTNPKNMSKDDWMDLIQGLKLITSGTKIVSNKARYDNIKKAAKAKGVGKAYEIEVRKGTGKERITLREKEVAKIMDQPSLEAANAELKRITGNDYALIPETSGILKWKKESTGNPINLGKLEGHWWDAFSLKDPSVKVLDFHPEDAYKALLGTKWATPRMRMFGWNASELERATGRAGKYGLKSQDSQFTTFRDLDTPTPEPKRSRTKRTNKKSNKSTTTTGSYTADTSTYDKQGGKLDRFGEYLKSRK